MNLIRTKTNDFVPVTFRSLVDQLFNDELTLSGGRSFLPGVDILETEKAFEIHLAAPGMKKDDFRLDLDDQFLTISGERKTKREENPAKFHIVEISYGSFSRAFRLPDGVLASKIEASYKDGILQVVLPKDEQKNLKTTIKVN